MLLDNCGHYVEEPSDTDNVSGSYLKHPFRVAMAVSPLCAGSLCLYYSLLSSVSALNLPSSHSLLICLLVQYERTNPGFHITLHSSL